MKRWTYMHEDFTGDFARLVQHLNARGGEGWEVVSLQHNLMAGEDSSATIFYKREDER